MKTGARPAGKTAGVRLLRHGGIAPRLLAGLILFTLAPLAAQAQDNGGPPLPRINLGGVGLIEMPSARMVPDGELSAGASYYQDTQHYNLGFQILPWLEGSFRYSGLQHFNPDYPVYWDRSFGLKARLWQEDDLLPAVAVGINDVVGTGVYSGEYLVASKQFGDFDATLGVGWGRLGSANTFRNPFAQISRSYETRASLTTPGGTNFNVFFHGPTAGVFGGVVWRSPLPGLSLIAEASSDDYPFERVQGSFTPHTQMNYGLSYEVTDEMTVGLNWLYGKAVGGSVSFHFDPTKPQYPETLGEPRPPPVIRSREAQQNALRILLGQRDPAEAARRATMLARAGGRNAFVDALASSGDFTDIRISGRTMVLTVAGGAEQQVCRLAASAARNSGNDIGEIVVQSTSRNISKHCAVADVASPALQSAVFLAAADLPERNLVSAPPVIDATAETSAAIRTFRADARKQQIFLDTVSFGESEATIYYTNAHYLSEADAIDRLTRLLMADAPSSIEKFRLIAIRNDVPQQEFNILRAPLERAITQNGEDISVFDAPVTTAPPPLDEPILSAAKRDAFPRFSWSAFPQFRQQFFDPNNPLGLQLLAAADAEVDLAPGLAIWGEGELSLVDTFNTNRQSDSVLPHVRTDFVKYFTDGKNGIGALQANYRFRLSPELFATLKAGYLESMFAGAGGEMLWRPQGQRWAIGADLYDVQQRDFDRLLGLQPYRAWTGHVTLYYASPWYDLDFQLRAGQYLAGDRGVTVQVTRRFSTGVEIGAFFTKTNVSAQQFGEGSFDKGIIIRIPIGWMVPIRTQNVIAMDLRPIQRDGGQALLGDATLYEETVRSSEGELVRDGVSFADIQ